MITYEQFLNSLISPINAFINCLSIFFNYIITNYFYITLIGLALISSLLYYFLSMLLYHFSTSSKDIDNHYSRKGD